MTTRMGEEPTNGVSPDGATASAAAELARLEHLNQLLQTIRQASQTLNGAREPIGLCEGVCRSLARTGGYLVVWIGRLDQAAGVVVPVAVAGAEAATFPQTRITWDLTPYGQGPAGTAIRERQPVVFEDLANDPRFAPWRTDAASLGAASIASFPLLFRERIYGVLTVKHGRVRAFDQEEVRWLMELATDIAHAWNSLEEILAHRRTRENLETLVAAIPDVVLFKDGEGRWQMINAAAQGIFQMQRRAWRGRTDADLAGDLPELAPTHEMCRATDEMAWAKRQAIIVEEQAIGSDGLTHTLEVHKVPLFHPDGRRKALVVIGRDITAAKRAQTTLRAAELMASASRDAILRLRCADGRILDANPAASALYGYDREALLRLSLQDLRPEADREAAWARLADGGEDALFEATHRRQDGQLFPVEVSLRHITVDGVPMVISNLRDISARKLADDRIRLLQTAVETAANGILVLDTHAIVTWANRAFLEFNNCPGDQITGLDLRRLPFGDPPPELVAAIKQQLSRGESWSGDLVTRRRDGARRELFMTVSPVQTTPGQITHFIAIQQDITENKQAARELGEAHRRLAQLHAELEQRVDKRTRELTEAKAHFETIFNCSPAGLAITRWGDGAFLDANQAFADMFGWTCAQLPDRTLADLVCEAADRVGLEAALVRDGRVRNLEVRGRKSTGERLDLMISAETIEVEGGRAILSNVLDITAQKHAAEVSRRHRLEIEDLYQRAPCGYHSLDRDGRILRMNDTELGWLGYAREDVIHHNLREFLSAPEQAKFEAAFATLLREHRVTDLEVEFRRRDGSPLPTVVNAVALTDEQGRFQCSRTTVFDNTERLKAERALREALSTAATANRAKSEFLANMSHEIRTPMHAIMGYAQMLCRDPALPPSARHPVDVISRNGRALLALLNNILELSRIEIGRAPLVFEVFSPEDLLAELIEQFRDRAQAKDLSLTLGSERTGPEFIEADQNKIRQAVDNLLSNAIKFTHQGGVEVRLQTAPLPEERWRLAVEVADTGPGMAPEVLARLFQQFGQAGSARGADVGTGLGLQLSRQFARLMGGDLTVQSRVGQGSTFRLVVPVTAAPRLGPGGDRLERRRSRRSGAADGPPPPEVGLNFPAEQVLRLPVELRHQLRAALVIGDFEAVFGLLEAVRREDAALGAGFLELARQYHAEALLRLLPG